MANELSKTEIKEIKISQNKIDEFSDEITNASELIENSMRVIKNVALSEHTINGDFEEWKKRQKIVRINLRKELNKSVKNSQILIKKTIQKNHFFFKANMLPSVEMGENSQQILNIYLIVFPVALTGCLPTKGSPPKF